MMTYHVAVHQNQKLVQENCKRFQPSLIIIKVQNYSENQKSDIQIVIKKRYSSISRTHVTIRAKLPQSKTTVI